MTENEQGWSPEDYPITLVTSDEQAREELAILSSAKQIAIDTETVIVLDDDGEPVKVDLDVDGPGPWRVMSIAARFADGTKRAWVIDMGYVNAERLVDLFEGIRPFGWNANFDRIVLTRDGLPVFDWWDGMLADAVLRCGAGGGDGRKYTSLAKAVRTLLGYDMNGKADTRLSYKTVAEEPQLSAEQVRYAAYDAIGTLEVCIKLGALLRAAGLVDTFVRECNAQRFIQMMVLAGLPLDVESYSAIIRNAEVKAAEAAEKIAVATTGRELLSTIVAWANHTGHGFTTEAAADDVVARGLELLHNTQAFDTFITDVKANLEAAKARIGTHLGIAAVEDLFAEADGATFVPLPFEVDDDTKLRAWLSKQVPHFAAAWVLAAREEGELGSLLATEAGSVLEAAGRRRKLTKDHDVDIVLDALTKAPGADVDFTLVQVAGELLAARRYQRIVSTYGDMAGQHATLVPTWNVGSDVQVKEMLNTYCTDAVRAYTAESSDGPRPLGRADSVDADALKMIGGHLPDGNLCESLLAFRANDKIVTTYGDKLLSLVNARTGRIHARYNQALTGTGRLASFKPNAQNLSPLAKPHMRPKLVGGKVRRVLVCADLSQAELRFVADAAQDVNMLEAFRSGEDLHARTAGLMFSLDMKALMALGEMPLAQAADQLAGLVPYATLDPERTAVSLYAELRQKAKRVSFGYAYGLGAGALARGLTIEGVPTTKEEAQALLDAFDKAYPQVAAWMATRVDFIKNLSDAMRSGSGPCGVDFTATWQLHLVHAKAHSAYNSLSKTLGRTPTELELAAKLKPNTAEELAAHLGREATQAEVDERLVAVANLASWALSHDHAVALADKNTAWSFESRTLGGRRRLFTVQTNQLNMAVVTQLVRSRSRDLQTVASNWLESWNSRQAAAHAAKVEAKKARGDAPVLKLTKISSGRTVNLDSAELEKVFEDRDMRTDFVGFVLTQLPADRMEQVWRLAMADRIRSMGNQFRNHPIQGGVADAMEVAFARITEDLVSLFPGAVPIQSVHDSIVIEVDVEQAVAVRDVVVGHMQEALASFCPSVPCVADGDIQLSLDAKKHTVSDDQLNELIEALAA